MKQINWDELFRKNAAQLKGLCRRYVGDADVAEDLVQDTFIAAIEKVSGYKATGSLEGWIRKIAVNKSLMYIREKQLNFVSAEVLSNQVEQDSEMENAKSTFRFAIEKASFSTDELLSVIDCLPLSHKVAFNLYVLDGYTHSQIAEMMNISPGTSKSNLARARKKAQELLYQKAIHKQPAENYRRSALLLLLFQPNYIDKVFRKGLRNFLLPVQAPNITFPPKTTLTIKWSATLIGKAVLYGGAICVLATGGYVGSWLAHHPQSAGTESAPVEVMCPPEFVEVAPTDTLAIAAEEKKNPEAHIKPEKEKVIIKKTIVIRDTIRLEKPVTK